MKYMWIVAALAACSGSGGTKANGGGGGGGGGAKTDFPALAAKCGITSDGGDPATQPIKDLNACRDYLVAAFDKLAAAKYAVKDNADTVLPANDIAEALCMQDEAKKQLKGIGCRYKAEWQQVGIWNGRTDDLAMRARMSSVMLDEACTAGDADACSIKATKKDKKGRTWTLEAKEPEGE